MISTRYAWAACLVLAIGLVPTVIHVYQGPPANVAGTLEARLAGFEAGDGSVRTAAWVDALFKTNDYVSRKVGDLEFFGAASYDWKKVFHFPENGLARGHVVTRSEERVVDGYTLRILEFETSKSTRVAVYTFLYGDEIVASPIGHVLRKVPLLFISARERMILLYAQVDGKHDDVPEFKKRLVALVTAAGNAARK